jgi:hypothetical protein
VKEEAMKPTTLPPLLQRMEQCGTVKDADNNRETEDE